MFSLKFIKQFINSTITQQSKMKKKTIIEKRNITVKNKNINDPI